MRINNEGKLSQWDREILEVIEEFDWSTKDLAEEIIALREKIENLEDAIRELREREDE